MMNPSPFYPNTNFQYAWNSSALGTYKDCPRKYYYQYICGYASKGEANIHLRFGSLIDVALERFDRHKVVDGDDFDTAVDKVVDWLLCETWDGREYIELGGGETHPVLDTGCPWDTSYHSAGAKKNRDTLLRTFIWYVEHFKEDPAHTIILANGQPARQLTFKFAIDAKTPMDEPYIFTGHLDRMVKYGDELFVMDHKTTGGGIAYNYIETFNPNNQMSLYTYAAKLVYGVPVQGVLLDALSILVGYTSFGRFITTRSDATLDEWMEDTVHWLRQAERSAEADYWPMNDQSCHKYDGCQFRKVCRQEPRVRKNFLETDFIIDHHAATRIMDP